MTGGGVTDPPPNITVAAVAAQRTVRCNRLLADSFFDNVQSYAHICKVISVRLGMAVTSRPNFSRHRDHDGQVK